MKKAPDKLYDVSDRLIALVEKSAKINLLLRKGNVIYERTLTPINQNDQNGITIYKHMKNTYEVINGPNGRVYRLMEKKDMPQTSTIGDKIYALLKTLEQSGYVLGQSTNWEVI